MIKGILKTLGIDGFSSLQLPYEVFKLIKKQLSNKCSVVIGQNTCHNVISPYNIGLRITDAWQHKHVFRDDAAISLPWNSVSEEIIIAPLAHFTTEGLKQLEIKNADHSHLMRVGEDSV